MSFLQLRVVTELLYSVDWVVYNLTSTEKVFISGKYRLSSLKLRQSTDKIFRLKIHRAYDEPRSTCRF